MFERFTDRARRVVVLAQEEARNLPANFIGTEHLLLGLLVEGEGIAGQVLINYLEPDQIRDSLPRSNLAVSGHIPFTPRTKKVLEYALREALQLGHGFVGTEHLLLGLLREKDGLGMDILTQAVGPDADRASAIDTVRADVIKLLGGPPNLDPQESRLKDIHQLLFKATRLQALAIELVNEIRRLEEKQIKEEETT